MACSYADGLSNYENKGKLGLPEKFDPAEEVERKAQTLAGWVRESKHTVVHTGAGISTAAGIPDFRGPKGVWTLEKEGLKPNVNISWDDAKPTLTHMAIVSLEQRGYVQYVVTQNIDGLHLRSGLPRKKLAELHGDMFVDKCNQCQRQFVRSSAATTVAQKSEGKSCPGKRGNSRRCRGKLHDNILDWEDGLPDADLELAISHACVADLSLCLGTTLQIVPSGNIPVDTKKRGGRLAICNLQPTKQDRHADLIVNTYVDTLMKRLLEILDVPLLPYSPKHDPLKLTQLLLQESQLLLQTSGIADRSEENAFEPIEWTIPEEWVTDKDLEERVKARKVIRKRSGVKEGRHERKKVKITQGSIQGEMKARGKEDTLYSGHRNGEVIDDKKHVNKEEEEEQAKDETDTVQNAKEKKTINTQNDEVLNIKEEKNNVKSEIGNGIKTKSEEEEEEEELEEKEKAIRADVMKQEQANGGVKSGGDDGMKAESEVKEEDKIEGSEACSNGTTAHPSGHPQGGSQSTKENRSNGNQNDTDTWQK